MKHTRMLAASIDGQSVKSNWNSAFRLMLMRAKEHYDDFEQIKRRCAVNTVPRAKDDKEQAVHPGRRGRIQVPARRLAV